MMTTNLMPAAANNDTELVGASLAGNRDAFGQIVSRYQSLICSLAYSATGSLGQSEDLAQETFIVAWKCLGHLRERDKLRAWLCGIARNRIHNFLRREGREPNARAESLEAIPETHAPEPLPVEYTITQEEQAILWRSLERLPETYREPLILFYREQQSIEAVAQSLDLTEDAVKQRLSRGRKLLHEQVLAFVEGALGKTNPGRAFTLAVLASLPLALTASAKAALAGSAAAKGSATAKAAGAAGWLAGVLSPVLGFFGMWVGYRTSMAASRSDRERKFNQSFYKRLAGCIGGFFALYLILIFCGGSLIKSSSSLFAGLAMGLALAYVLAMIYYSIWCYRARKKLLSELTAAERDTHPARPVWEYRSRFHLLGLPFIHIRSGDRLGEPIKAWIAIGDCALGIIFAFGGLAIAPVSVGGCALGVFSLGGLSLGGLALGGVGLGLWAFGGLAMGWQAFGGCAIAWNAAWGGYAVAHGMALGGMVHAAQTNDQLVQDLLKSNPFFHYSAMILPHLFWLNLVWVAPMVIQRIIVAQRRPQAQDENPTPGI